MNWGRLYFGLIVVSVGTILLLGNAGIVETSTAFGVWWPIVIIIAGLVSLVANRNHWPIGLIIVAVGTGFLLSNLDVVNLGNVLWPIILIAVGLIIIFGRTGRTTDDTGDVLNSFHVFSGAEVTSRSSQFRGGSISAVFGGAEIDLRQAKLAPDAALDVFLAFGGLELKVPQDWNVSIKGFPIFGGFENKTAKGPISDDAPTLLINATVMFGGMEVRH